MLKFVEHPKVAWPITGPVGKRQFAHARPICTFPWPQAPTEKQTRAVAADGIKPKEDILSHLLALNHACAEKEKAGEKFTPPGLPLPPEDLAAFITTDCIQAPQL